MGQAFGVTALLLFIAAFASKHDDRLLIRALFANIAMAAQFALFQSWVAAGISALIIVRIALVRRLAANVAVMTTMLVATAVIAVLAWNGPADIPALAGGLLGTYGMFMLRGIPMRVVLAAAAFCWLVSNILAGSIGGTIAETLIFLVNATTIWRLKPDTRSVPSC